MIRLTLSLWLSLVGAASLAHGLSDAQIDVERDRIADQRRAAQVQHTQERVSCYQRFAVEDCLRESRQRLRQLNEDLRRQESALNEMQRKRRGAEQLKRLDEKAAERAQASPPAGSPQAIEDQQKAREARAAEHANSRQAREAEAAANRASFEARQRERAQNALAAEQRRAEAPLARERYERKQAEALRRRLERERANAARGDSSAAPLPVPAPPSTR